MELLFILGLFAGLLQLLGYVLYLNIAAIEPNPTSWLMWAYGTAILTILEFDSEATLAELILPLVCSVMAIVVALKCWLVARRINPNQWWPSGWWPNNHLDRLSLQTDILITVGYVSAWLLAYSTLISTDAKTIAVLIFLVLSNLSAITEFLPILRSTHREPESEHWLPWFVWTGAYFTLGIVTYLTHETFWTFLMLYPALSVVLHSTVGFLALGRQRA